MKNVRLTIDTLKSIDLNTFMREDAIDITFVEDIDTFGAIYVLELLEKYPNKILKAKEEHIKLINSIKELSNSKAKRQNIKKEFKVSFDFLEYIGILVLDFLRRFKEIEISSFFKEVESAGFGSVFILGMLSLLVGMVIAYQSAAELSMFGANIFVVNLIGISSFRELGPLITGIILAGRVSSGYTADIGIRKVYEELDALEVMGFSYMVILGIPRIIALVFITPTLVLISSNIMVLGGAIIAKTDLGIPFDLFYNRLKDVVGFEQVFVGLIKAPFFGAYIGLTGTYFGFYSGKKPEEVAFNVMKSVVSGISGIILIDALFSVIFAKFGI